MTNEELSSKVAEARGEKLESKMVLNTSHKDCGKMHDRFMHRDRGENMGVFPYPTPYATDMSEAWKLVEEMAKDNYAGTSVSVDDFTEDGSFNFCVYYSDERHPIYASTMPRAICKAYLKFKESE